MPQSSLKLAIARQWETLRKLPSRGPGITCGQITAYLRDEKGFQVSKRTVERDLTELASQFGIHCNDKSMPYGWHWMPGKQCEFGSVDMADALSLILAQDILEHLLPPAIIATLQSRFELARSKLAAVNGHKYSRWIKKVRYVPTTMSLIPPRVDARILATIQEALLQERQVIIRYTGPGDRKAQVSTLHPLGLIQRGTTTYLVATAYKYPDPRLYAIHRMSYAELRPEKIVSRSDYNIDQHIASGVMQFGSLGKIRLKATITNELGIYLTESPLSEKQSIKAKQNYHILTAEVPDSWQLRWWILSQGAAITLLGPRHLRAEIHNTLTAASAHYKQPRTP